MHQSKETCPSRYSQSKLHRVRCHVANIVQGVGVLIRALPRAATDVPVFLVRSQGHEDRLDKYCIPRRYRVADALMWLKLKQTWYQHVQKDNAGLQALPVAGHPTGLRETTKPALSSV